MGCASAHGTDDTAGPAGGIVQDRAVPNTFVPLDLFICYLDSYQTDDIKQQLLDYCIECKLCVATHKKNQRTVPWHRQKIKWPDVPEEAFCLLRLTGFEFIEQRTVPQPGLFSGGESIEIDIKFTGAFLFPAQARWTRVPTHRKAFDFMPAEEGESYVLDCQLSATFGTYDDIFEDDRGPRMNVTIKQMETPGDPVSDSWLSKADVSTSLQLTLEGLYEKDAEDGAQELLNFFQTNPTGTTDFEDDEITFQDS